MDAVKFIKEYKRMIHSIGGTGDDSYICNGADYTKCPISGHNNWAGVACTDFKKSYPEKVVEYVEDWSKNNPQKTILDEFLENYPNATGRPVMCVKYLGYKVLCCGYDCNICWNMPLPE